MPHFIPTERDKEVLNWMLQQIRNMPVNTPSPSVLDPSLRVHPGTGAYIAKVPTDGIPGMSTNLGDSTGTGTADEADAVLVPGKAKCEIYKIVMQADGVTPVLRKYETLEKWVFNITTATITDNYVSVMQLADGKWLAVQGGGGGCDSLKSLSSYDPDGPVQFLAQIGGTCVWIDGIECIEEPTTGTGTV